MVNLSYLEHAEYETYYPRIMLHARMNKNIKFVKECQLANDDFDTDFDS
jgi:hypothetical protein